MLKQYKNPVIYAQNLDKKISEDYILVIRKQQKLFSKDKTEVINKLIVNTKIIIGVCLAERLC